jgi:hypothetical protein
MYKKTFLFTYFMILISCNTTIDKSNYNNQSKNNNYCDRFKNNTVIYRFLYLNDYPVQIDENRFWNLGKVSSNEFAIRVTSFPFKSIINSIKTFERVNERTGEYTFAIVNECKDTVYASKDLKDWIIKNNGVSEFYTFPITVSKTTDTLFIQKILKSEPFLRNWKCDDRL